MNASNTEVKVFLFLQHYFNAALSYLLPPYLNDRFVNAISFLMADISINVALARMEQTVTEEGKPVYFTIEFIKEDGSIRKMRAQKHVKFPSAETVGLSSGNAVLMLGPRFSARMIVEAIMTFSF